MTKCKPPSRSTSYDKKTSLVLQGGGALGSYQAGVYEALASSEYLPDWVTGISIGSINASIIAGNAPQDRVARLRDFWEEVTAPTAWWPSGLGQLPMTWQRKTSALAALTFGQPGFFAPWDVREWIFPESPISFYNTNALRRTLERLVDFDRINNPKEMRLSMGAVNIRTGQLIYFDSDEITIGPEHVMASGALPPGFPPIEVDGQHYWDGGLVSNTPLQYTLDYYPRRSRLCFQVDVFHGSGKFPDNLEEVSEREKDIRYSSRTRINTDVFRQKHEVRHAINELHKLLPPEIMRTEQAQQLYSFGCVTEMDIVQLIYRPLAPQGASKDYEFSRGTMNARWDQGRSDASTTLQVAPWLAPKSREVGVRVFDVVHDILVSNRKANGKSSPVNQDLPSTLPAHLRSSKVRLKKRKSA